MPAAIATRPRHRKYAGCDSTEPDSRVTWPPTASPTAVARNHTPIIWLAKAAGASLVVTDRPTGYRDSSPVVWIRYVTSSHSTETRTPPDAAVAAIAMTTKEAPTRAS